jgi:hypothetical protein
MPDFIIRSLYYNENEILSRAFFMNYGLSQYVLCRNKDVLIFQRRKLRRTAAEQTFAKLYGLFQPPPPKDVIQ